MGFSYLLHGKLFSFFRNSPTTIVNSVGVAFSIHRRQSLTTNSPTKVGKNFELVSVQVLKEYGFDIIACGGPKDKGVDFRGEWKLANYKSFPVVGQCKRFKRRLGPRYIREMEGVLSRECELTLGVLVTELGYTKDGYQASMSSRYPVILSAIVRDENRSNFEIEEMNEDTSAVVHNNSCNIGDNNYTPTNDCPILDGWTHNYNSDSLDNFEPKHDNDLKDYLAMDRKTFLDKPQLKRNRYVTIGKQCTLQNVEKFNERQSHEDDFVFSRVVPFEKNSSNKEVTDEIFDSDDAPALEESVRLSLFEMNHRARQLLPFLIIGTKYDTKKSRVPDLMFLEGDSIHHIKG